jgi:hypothetical protein
MVLTIFYSTLKVFGFFSEESQTGFLSFPQSPIIFKLEQGQKNAGNLSLRHDRVERVRAATKAVDSVATRWIT